MSPRFAGVWRKQVGNLLTGGGDGQKTRDASEAGMPGTRGECTSAQWLRWQGRRRSRFVSSSKQDAWDRGRDAGRTHG